MPKPLLAGAINRRVTIQAVTDTTDAGGGRAQTWAMLATVWARVEPLSGDERARAEQVAADLSHRVTVRYRDDVTPRHRLLYGSRVLKILAVRDADEKHERLELLCAEVA